MAPVYDFRHVELDKIGRGKRIVKPPGGECSDIFGNGVAPHSPDQLTPRKANNYMQSTIFSPDSPDSSNYYSNHSTPATTPSKLLPTAERLFGSTDDHTPRKIVNRQRSSIFEEEVSPRTPSAKSGSARRPMINPITGAAVSQNGTSNGSHNGTPNGVNGTSNGTHNGTPNGSVNGHSNGTCNGHSTPESPLNGTPRSRIPPGGKSSGIF